MSTPDNVRPEDTAGASPAETAAVSTDETVASTADLSLQSDEKAATTEPDPADAPSSDADYDSGSVYEEAEDTAEPEDAIGLPDLKETELPITTNETDQSTQEGEINEPQTAADVQSKEANDVGNAKDGDDREGEDEVVEEVEEGEGDDLPSRRHIPASLLAEISGAPPPQTSGSTLLEAKQSEISIKFGSKDESLQRAIESGTASIKKTFHDIKNVIGHMPAELVGGRPIDWEFWGRVVDNYGSVVHNDEQHLLAAVALGIPKEIRGIIWQLVARSKSLQLEELYMHLKGEGSVHERAIKRDLTRTSFYTNVDAANKADELYNVIKAYSNFDPDVGYTQGMAFIAVPLVMNMTEGECFCLLVTLMKEYGLRELFCPDMKGLHLLLHQFDRLLEKHLPLLFNHLTRQGIRLLMYASQWFLTFFSYKFPLDVVLRIFDMVITQGIEAVLRLALNLMLQNEQSLLRLNFDALLEFLKLNLFNVYVSEDFVKGEENRRFSLIRKSPSKQSTDSGYYKLDAFIQDAMLVAVSPLDLARYKVEFDQMCTRDASRKSEIDRLRDDNGTLRHEIKTLESELFALNHDHIDLVQKLVDTKVLLPEVLSDVEELQEAVAALQADVQDLEAKLGADLDNLPLDIDSKIQQLLAENALETERFANLEEQLTQLTLENDTLRTELKLKGKKWFWS